MATSQSVIRRRQAQIAYSRVDTALKVMCTMATMATFLRIAAEHKLPPVFLNLPFLQLILVAVEKSDMIRMDDMTLSMLKGASTGVISGFLSSIVVTDLDHSREERSTNLYIRLLNNFELLHIPVVMGTLFFSFCITFQRLPPQHRVKTAALTGLVAAILITVLVNITDDSSGENTRSKIGYAKIFAICFVLSFMLSLSLVAKDSQKPWLVCTAFIVLTLSWEVGYFDDLIWDLTVPKLPIPGFLIGMIVLNLQDLTTDQLKPPQDKVSCKHDDIQLNDSGEYLWNAYVWHTVTFIIERISLAVISFRQHRKSPQTMPPNDSFICCGCTLVYLAIICPFQSSQFFIEGSTMSKTTIILLGIVLYSSYGLVNGLLNNGFFIDTILALTILFIMQRCRSSSNGLV